MTVRKLFTMQNNFRQQTEIDEGICTITALQWAKVCLMYKRGIGSYDQLQLTDHQRNGLMAIYRRLDAHPVQQSAGIGLKVVGGRDHTITKYREINEIFSSNAPHIGIFWNSFHTMGYRIGEVRGRKEYEWFDNNHGLYLSNDADEMKAFMKNYMTTNYREKPSGVRVVNL